MTFKNIFLISDRHLFSWNWQASNIKGISFSLSPPLCSNFQDVPGIFGFLQMKFTVTHGVIVKRVHMYFIRNMYPLSRGKCLTSHKSIRFGSILRPLFSNRLRWHFEIYGRFTLPECLCMDIPQTRAAIKTSTFI